MEKMNVAADRQPKQSDPKEIAIKLKLEKTILSTQFARDFIVDATNLQSLFFKKALSVPENYDDIYNSYTNLLSELSIRSNSKITSGVNYLDDITNNKGVIVITNHLGIIKLTKIDDFEPFPLRHASILPIAQKLNMNLHESAIELPGELLKIQKSCKIVVVSAGGNNRTQQLIDDTRKIIERERSVIVMYPEGGTSGKRNNGDPYDLDDFHTGAFVVAKALNIPILPVTQFFNPSSGFELDILEPIDNDTINLDKISKNIQNMMQIKLNFQNSFSKFQRIVP